jgi:hypothetical protein
MEKSVHLPRYTGGARVRFAWCVSRVCVMRCALSGRMRDPERRFYQPWPVLWARSLSLWRQKWRLGGEMCARLDKQTAKFISPFRITRAPEKIFALSFYNNTRAALFLPGDATCLLKLRASTSTPCSRAQDFLTNNSLGLTRLIRVCWAGLAGGGGTPRVKRSPQKLPRGASDIVVRWPGLCRTNFALIVRR